MYSIGNFHIRDHKGKAQHRKGNIQYIMLYHLLERIALLILVWYSQFFSCWNQLLTLMFGQLSNRESLRDLIVAIVKHDMKLERSTYEVLQILSISLTDKTPLRELFDKTIFNNDKERTGSSEPLLFNFD